MPKFDNYSDGDEPQPPKRVKLFEDYEHNMNEIVEQPPVVEYQEEQAPIRMKKFALDADDFMAAVILMNIKDNRIPSQRTEQYIQNTFNGIADDGEGVEEIERFDHVLQAFAPIARSEEDSDDSDSDYESIEKWVDDEEDDFICNDADAQVIEDNNSRESVIKPTGSASSPQEWFMRRPRLWSRDFANDRE